MTSFPMAPTPTYKNSSLSWTTPHSWNGSKTTATPDAPAGLCEHSGALIWHPTTWTCPIPTP